MSAKPAAIPLFGDAYLADTRHLTTEDHGAYLLLIMSAWRQEDCALPCDDHKLARIVGLTPRKWAAIKPTIMEFWQVENGRMFHSGRATQAIERKAISRFVLAEVIARDGMFCRYCRAAVITFEIDHIMPWSRGGPDTADNLCVSCAPCNRAKSDRTPEEMGWIA